jgi:hypothetical protein
MYDNTLKNVHFQKSGCYLRVFFVIRQCFSPSASVSRHPPVFLRHPPVSLAIRNYFLPSATISRHPQLFSAIRNYLPPSATNPRLSATISRHPQLSPAIRNYPSPSATITSPQQKVPLSNRREGFSTEILLCKLLFLG